MDSKALKIYEDLKVQNCYATGDYNVGLSVGLDALATELNDTIDMLARGRQAFYRAGCELADAVRILRPQGSLQRCLTAWDALVNEEKAA